MLSQVAAGGVAGYAAKRSVPSLVAGGASGLALIACGQTGRFKMGQAGSVKETFHGWICGSGIEEGYLGARVAVFRLSQIPTCTDSFCAWRAVVWF